MPTVPLAACALLLQQPMFTEGEREQIRRFWAQPDRIRIVPEQNPRYVVNITPEGSKWIWDCNRAIPFSDASASARWSDWRDRFLAYEQAIVMRAALERNRRAGLVDGSGDVAVLPPAPGPVPAELAKRIPNPPTCYEALPSILCEVRIDSDASYRFRIPTVMRRAYSYYRSRTGVQYAGTSLRSMSEEELAGLMKDAGIAPSPARVFAAVSLLEGGFDAFNSYDTGFVSFGLLQFASLSDGVGSLGPMLLQFKADSPAEFDKYLRRYGVDVTPDGKLVLVHPESGFEAIGSEANQLVRDDMRFAAAMCRAGARCRAFKVAQLRFSYNLYYKGMLESSLAVRFADGQPSTVRIGDFIRSEAGRATMLDRYVNTGRLSTIGPIVQSIIDRNKLSSASQLPAYERAILDAAKYRMDFQNDRRLSQPGGG